MSRQPRVSVPRSLQSGREYGADPSSFETTLRLLVDSKYRRRPSQDNPLWRLVNDELPLAECRAFYVRERASLGVFNRVLLARLLSVAPSAEVRRELMPVISVEFGLAVESAHPRMYDRFLRALGVGSGELRASPNPIDPAHPCREEIEALGRMSWCELLARLLVGETQGPVVFPPIVAALKRNYGLSDADLTYFSIHATHDKKDAEILFGLLGQEAKTEADREAVLAALEDAFSSGRYARTACLLEAEPQYTFEEAAKSAAGARASSDRPRKRGEATLVFDRTVRAALDEAVDHETVSGRELGAELGSGLTLTRAAGRAELGRFWRALGQLATKWEYVTAPRLLEACPDLNVRVGAWQTVQSTLGAHAVGQSVSELVAWLADDLERHGLSEGATGPLQPPLSSEPPVRDYAQFVCEQVVAPAAVYFERAESASRAIDRAGAAGSDERGPRLDQLLRHLRAIRSLGVELLARYSQRQEHRETVAMLRKAMRTQGVVLASSTLQTLAGGSLSGGRGEPEAEKTVLGALEFEQELRRCCDAAYHRKSDPGNPMLALTRGKLSREAALTFWGERWNRILVLNQVLLPALLRKCPDLVSRAMLWRSISVEYGEGEYERSHPALYLRFLKALGVAREPLTCMDAVEGGSALGLTASVQHASWLELLGGFLARETVGPKVFGTIRRELQRQFDLSAEDVDWFTVHEGQDLQDADDMFALARRFGGTAAAQETLRSAVLSWFDANREYCCALSPTYEVNYAAKAAGPVGASSLHSGAEGRT